MLELPFTYSSTWLSLALPNIGALRFTLDVVFFHVAKMRENTQKVVVASQAE
jgi:hypothetical protein